RRSRARVRSARDVVLRPGTTLRRRARSSSRRCRCACGFDVSTRDATHHRVFPAAATAVPARAIKSGSGAAHGRHRDSRDARDRSLRKGSANDDGDLCLDEETSMSKPTSGVSRRRLFQAAAAVATAVGAPIPAVAQRSRGADRRDDDDRDLVLVNGLIHTMDDRNSIVTGVRIKNGRFADVGGDVRLAGAKVINLRGLTVVPGLIESHTHFVSLCNRPGYHVAGVELASNLSEVLAMLAARRADVPPGQFITAMGAGTPRMWAELRMPTLAELDAAVPDRPVFIYQGGAGPARTNTLGKQFFESATAPLAGPVTVAADGSIAGGNPNMANRALYHLRIRQTFDDKKRSALDAMA